MSKSIQELVALARSGLSELTGLELSTTIGVEKYEDGIHVRIELVEKRSIPDSMDILAAYDVRLNDEGEVLDFKRVGMRKRIDSGILEEQEA
jgi:hypothetical protein